MIFNPVLHPLLLVLVLGLLLTMVVLQSRRAGKIQWLTLIRRGLVAVLLFIIALRPGIPGGNAEAVVLTQDLDVFLVVDTTGSIAAEDIEGERTRLDLVREDIVAITESYPGARFSLITFDRTAVQRIPLSTDLGAVHTAARILSPEITLYSGGSSISEARVLLKERLEAAQRSNPERSRAVFYFGDGEQTVSEAPESFAESAPLISGGAVFGYGTAEGGHMREQRSYFDQEMTDNWIEDFSTGARAVSRIDEDNLRAIASQLGVEYFHRSAVNPTPSIDIQVAAGQELSVSGSSAQVADELYWVFALAILPLIAWEMALIFRGLFQTARLMRRIEQR